MIKKSDQKQGKPLPMGIFVKKAPPISKSLQKDKEPNMLLSDQTTTHKKCFQREIPINPSCLKKIPLDKPRIPVKTDKLLATRNLKSDIVSEADSTIKIAKDQTEVRTRRVLKSSPAVCNKLVEETDKKFRKTLPDPKEVRTKPNSTTPKQPNPQMKVKEEIAMGYGYVREIMKFRIRAEKEHGQRQLEEVKKSHEQKCKLLQHEIVEQKCQIIQLQQLVYDLRNARHPSLFRPCLLGNQVEQRH